METNTAPACARCGQPFEPDYLEALKKPSRMCEACMCRNLIDACGLPTPPELLDKYTMHPTLTEAEFRLKLGQK